ncbi:hypothetical protein Tco_0513946 [Tanacetum coccineum]
MHEKMSDQLVEINKTILKLQMSLSESQTSIAELEELGQTRQTLHMTMPSKDKLYNGRKGLGFENPLYFSKAKESTPTLYDEKVIGLGSYKSYVPNVILEKIIIDLEDEVVSLLEKEKEHLVIIDSLKSIEERVFKTKTDKLEKVLAQLNKDSDDVNAELVKRIQKYETYFDEFDEEND